LIMNRLLHNFTFFVLALAAPFAAHAGEAPGSGAAVAEQIDTVTSEETVERMLPMNLSAPRKPADAANESEDAEGTDKSADDSSHPNEPPYGAGFEARRHRFEHPEWGGGFGGGGGSRGGFGGMGGGRGMGRGR